MKKILILTLAAACLLAACGPKNNYLNVIDTDWKMEKLKGRVRKMVTTTQYDFYVRKSLKEFNEKGFLVNRIDTTTGGTFNTYSYEYRYDTLNRTTTIVEVEKDGHVSVEKNKYDEYGNLVTNTHGGGTWEYKYDDKRRKIKEWVYDGKDLRSKYVITYKPDGSYISTRYDGETGLRTDEETANDESSVNLSFNGAGKVIGRWETRTNKAKHTVYIEARSGGKIELRSTTWYNEFGDEIKEIKLNVGENRYDTLISEYTYDKLGNWINIKGHRPESREIIYW